MIKVIVVDDSQVELNGIVNSVNWEELEVEIIKTATNGKEALDYISQYKPDIVISDIRMPIMDGIELATEIRKRSINTRIIFLSAYGEFDYAKKGIELDVDEYIMKPVRLKQLREKILAVVNKCIEDKKRKIDEEELKKQITESLPLLKEKFLLGLINKQYHEKKLIEEKIEYLKVNMDINGSYMIIIAACSIKENLTNERRLLRQQYFINEMNSISNEFNHFFITQVNDENFVIIYQLNKNIHDKNHFNQLDILFSNIENNIAEKANMQIVYFIGRVVEGLDNLNISYEDAQKLQKYNVILGQEKYIYFDDNKLNISNDEKNMQLFRNKVEDDLLRVLASDSEKQVRAFVKMFYREHFTNKNNASNAYIQNLSNYLFMVCQKVASEMCGYSFGIAEGTSIKEVYDMYTIADIEDWFFNLIVSMQNVLNKSKVDKTDKIANDILNIINNSYGEELTLNKISEILFFSPNYLGAIFKRKYNKNFMDYLTNVRMERAKYLLNNTDKKIYDICTEVGFSNVSYFGARFKKMYGITPTEFREYGLS